MMSSHKTRDMCTDLELLLELLVHLNLSTRHGLDSGDVQAACEGEKVVVCCETRAGKDTAIVTAKRASVAKRARVLPFLERTPASRKRPLTALASLRPSPPLRSPAFYHYLCLPQLCIKVLLKSSF